MREYLVHRFLRVLIAAAGCAGFNTYAAESAAEPESKIEEIVVTAQKRSENLQQVPISAQVVNNQTLVEQNYNTLDTLTQILPGVHVDTANITNELFIRGVGSGGNAAFDQSVATFVDDIYHGRSRMSETTFLDLDRIEVLKGPQSTYFGNNAIAGALNIVTRKPGDAFDAAARALYGMFGQYAVEGAAGGPISDTFGARLAVMRNGESGWIKNVFTGRDAPDTNNGAARLTLVYRPFESLDATFKIEGSENKTSGTPTGLPSQWHDCPPAPPLLPGSAGSHCDQALLLGAAVPMGLNSNLNTGLPGQGNSLSTFEDVLTVNYHQWDHTFTSVTGFYNYHFNTDWDQGNLPVFTTLASQIPEKYHQFSQEFRLASPAGGMFQYQVGAYYQTDRTEFLSDTNLPEFNGLATAVFGIPAQYTPLSVQNGFSQHEDVYSVFGSLSWNATDRLRLTAGLRGSRDDKEDTGHVHYGYSQKYYGGFTPLPPALESIWSFIFGPPGDSNHLSRSDNAWMPSGGIQYQLIPEVMAYATFSKGFKAGGINGENGLNKLEEYEYRPEFVKAYEIGLKSKWFDDTVLVNVDVFRSDYQDLQVNTLQYDPIAKIFLDSVGNAAESRSQGVELETQWIITKDFRLAANLTYLDSFYASYSNAPPTTIAQFKGAQLSDLTGQTTPFAPRWSGSLVAKYSVALPAGFKLTSQLDPYITSSYYTQSGDPFYYVHAYVRLDGQLSLESPDAHWAVDLIGKNLTDRLIIAVPGFTNAAKEEPRNVAVQFRYRY